MLVRTGNAQIQILADQKASVAHQPAADRTIVENLCGLRRGHFPGGLPFPLVERAEDRAHPLRLRLRAGFGKADGSYCAIFRCIPDSERESETPQQWSSLPLPPSRPASCIRPSSPAVLPIAALMIYSYQFLQEKNIGLSHGFGAKTPKHDSGIDGMHKHRHAPFGCFQQRENSPDFRANAQKPRTYASVSAQELSSFIYRRPEAAPPAAHSAGEHPDMPSGCRRNSRPACCRYGCYAPLQYPR